MADTAAVTVWVREVNKPSVWSGLFNASTGAALPSLTVSEATPYGTPVARVAFTDPNTGFPWNALNYALLPVGVGASLFTMNPTTGVLTTAAPLAYWDTPTFSLVVSCTDSDPLAPLTSNATITVNLAQVNTVSIASFGLVRRRR